MELKHDSTKILRANDLELHTRWEHGQHRVTVRELEFEGRSRIQRRYTLHGDQDLDFGSTSAFLKHVTHGKIKNLSHARYFLLNGVQHQIQDSDSPILAVVRSPIVVIRRSHMGIDLKGRGIEVKKILYSCFGRKIVAMGYDPEEVLQEVYLKLAKANGGENPYNPHKSAFSHYVHMACNSLILNYRKKEIRRESKIVTGVRMADGDTDAGDAAVAIEDRGTIELEVMVRSVKERIGGNELAGQILDLLAAGYPRRELARELGVEPRKVSGAMKLLQKVGKKISQEWM